jgi:hypothetical protein
MTNSIVVKVIDNKGKNHLWKNGDIITVHKIRDVTSKLPLEEQKLYCAEAKTGVMDFIFERQFEVCKEEEEEIYIRKESESFYD